MPEEAQDPSEPEREADPAAQAKGPGVGRLLYRLALAGVGGVVLAQEELSGLFQRRELESADGAGTATDEPPGTVGAPGSISPMEAAVDRVLRSLCLPTRSDVDELRRGVDALAERINSLRD